VFFLFKIVAQNSANTYYYFTLECPVFSCDILGNIIDSNYIVAPRNASFILIDEVGDNYIIRFNLMEKKLRQTFNFIDSDMSYYRYFLISKAQFDFKSSAKNSRNASFTVGNVIAPIKIRSNPFAFSKDVMLGPTFGLKIQNQERNLSSNFLTGIGISYITLDSITTYGVVKNNVEIISFSPSIGILMQFGNAQIGLFGGFDILQANVVEKWQYRNKPWFSFGIGYELFSK
jgi:hypothetical protein